MLTSVKERERESSPRGNVHLWVSEPCQQFRNYLIDPHSLRTINLVTQVETYFTTIKVDNLQPNINRIIKQKAKCAEM